MFLKVLHHTVTGESEEVQNLYHKSWPQIKKKDKELLKYYNLSDFILSTLSTKINKVSALYKFKSQVREMDT